MAHKMIGFFYKGHFLDALCSEPPSLEAPTHLGRPTRLPHSRRQRRAQGRRAHLSGRYERGWLVIPADHADLNTVIVINKPLFPSMRTLARAGQGPVHGPGKLHGPRSLASRQETLARPQRKVQQCACLGGSGEVCATVGKRLHVIGANSLYIKRSGRRRRRHNMGFRLTQQVVHSHPVVKVFGQELARFRRPFATPSGFDCNLGQHRKGRRLLPGANQGHKIQRSRTSSLPVQ